MLPLSVKGEQELLLGIVMVNQLVINSQLLLPMAKIVNLMELLLKVEE